MRRQRIVTQVRPANTSHPDFLKLNAQLRDWLTGKSKNQIERDEYDDPKSHGKLMSRLWREVLGVETEELHPMQVRINELEEEVRRLRRVIEKKNVTIKKLQDDHSGV